IRDIRNGSMLIETNTDSAISALAWISTNRLASGGTNGIIRLFDIASTNGLALAKELKGQGGAITCLEPFGDNELLSGSSDGSVFQWNLAKGEVTRKLKHEGAVAAMAVRKDGKRFASAGLDKVVR